LPSVAIPFYNHGVHIGIDSRLPYYRMGGISQYVVQLISALAEVDADSRYSVLHSWKDGRSRLPKARNFRRGNLWTPCHHRLERWTLAAELVPRQLDVFHSPDFIPPSFGARRRVITVHDLNFLYYPQFLTHESRRYYAGQINWAVSVADHVAADSHATRQDLIEQLGVEPDKVSTVHLAAKPIYHHRPDPQDVAQTLQQLSLPAEFILFVGTLEPRKNLPTLIKAYARVRREIGYSGPLVIAGARGWLDDEIPATIEAHGLRQHIVHLSNIDDQRLAHLYRAAALLALPSFYEGFGLTALEAMVCECPVVASDTGSLPEVVGRAGILCAPEDVEAWVEALARVLTDDGLRQKLESDGRAQAAKFSWRNTATAMVRIYHDG
jgi:glycosyltransferase involved in cell wall biosynthesis